jgi:hypothetical protein
MGIIQDLIGPQNRDNLHALLPLQCPRLFCPVTPSLCIKGSVPKTRSILDNQQRHTHKSDIETSIRDVGSHLLELELLRELLVELLQFGDEFATGFDDGGFGCDVAVGVDAELESREERVRDLVGGEGDVLHAVELVAEHVCEGVVLLVECELSGVGDLCMIILVTKLDCDVDVV